MSWLLIVGLKNAILALPLAAAALFVGRFAKRPALAHLLWVIVLVKLITPPLIDVPVGWRLDVESWVGAHAENTGSSISGDVTAPRPQQTSHLATPPADPPLRRVIHRRTRPAPGDEAALAVAIPSAWEPASSDWARRLTSVPTWLAFACAAWLTGSTVMLAIMLVCGWRFRRFVRLAEKRDHELAIRVAELAAHTGVRIPPKVVVVEGVVSPMLWGLGQNVRIIFPAQLVQQLSPAARDSLLLHELAHYSRGDHWIRGLELVACVLYWWNPMLWLALRRIEAAEEECCDAWVVDRQRGDRHSYAEALLTTIDFLCDSRPVALPPAACGLGEVALLRARLVQIIHGDPAARLSRTVQVLVLTAGLVISPLEPALWATSAPRIDLPSSFEIETRINNKESHRIEPRETARSQRQAILAPPVRAVVPRAVAASAVPARPALPVLWATAVSPDGQFRLEARTGMRVALVNRATKYRVDLSYPAVTCVSFAPTSAVFASGHEDGDVRLGDSSTGGWIRSLKGLNEPVTSVQISPDGRLVAAGARNGEVLVWDLADGEEVARLGIPTVSVSCLRWSKAGDRLAIAFGRWSDEDRAALVVWSHEKNTIELEEPLSSPVGALDWLDQDQRLIIARWDGQAAVWSLAEGGPVWGVQLQKDDVSAAAWSPDCPLRHEWPAAK